MNNFQYKTKHKELKIIQIIIILLYKNINNINNMKFKNSKNIIKKQTQKNNDCYIKI